MTRAPTPLPRDRVRESLETVRTLVAADGGDIELTDVGAESATLTLILEGAECRECVMPRRFLEQVALDMMAPAVPGLTSISIIDPREQP